MTEIEQEVSEAMAADPNYPLGETDAMKWAVAWRLIRDRRGIDANASQAAGDIDGWMVGWFANAMASADPKDVMIRSLTSPFHPMEEWAEWERKDEAVLLMVDYSDDGEHAIDDALVALTIGHNNDHNVGEGEGSGWQFAGWCWSHDHYTEGRGKPIGWLPLPHHLAREVEEQQAKAL